MIIVSCLQLTQYLNRVFRMSISCRNTRSKSLAKWYDCLNINEFLWPNYSISSTKLSFSSAKLVGFGMYLR